MESLKQQRKYGKAKTMRRRLMGAGLLTAALAGLILIIPTGSDYTASQRETASTGITEELVITEIAQSTDEAPVLASLEKEPSGEVALGFSPSGTPEYVTTQVPYIEIPAPVLLADNWMPSAPPANIGDGDAQPAVQAPGPRAPAVAGVPGGGSDRPQGTGAPWPGGGSPGGGNSGPRSPSSPSTSGPSAPPSDPMPGDNGPLVAGPPATSNPGPQTASVPDAPANPPASNQPGPVDLPTDLNGPLVAGNDVPRNDWNSPGNSPGILEIDGPFTLGAADTLLFEILGPNPGVGGYDQLIVNGDVTLDAGNVVFAFINGYAPDVLTAFELILADSIQVGSGVSFHYGFFGTDHSEHAPYDLSAYDRWIDPLTTPVSGISMSVTEASSDNVRDGLLAIEYGNGRQSPPAGGDDPQPFDPIDIGAEIPAPAPLLLLATGLLLAGSFRRRA